MIKKSSLEAEYRKTRSRIPNLNFRQILIRFQQFFVMWMYLSYHRI